MSIRARIHVHHAVTGQRSQVLKLDIWNDLTGTTEHGNYRYRVRTDGHNREGAVNGFYRHTPNGAVVLVKEVLDQVLGLRPLRMDFGQFLVLLEAAWNGKDTPTRIGIINDAMGPWYHPLSAEERRQVFEKLSSFPPPTDNLRRKLLARYDPAAQRRVVTGGSDFNLQNPQLAFGFDGRLCVDALRVIDPMKIVECKRLDEEEVR